MIHLAWRLTRHDLRADPVGALAVALLLTVAGVLPAALSVEPVAGLLLAVPAAAVTALGAVAAHQRRDATLHLNGGDRGLGALVAGSSMVLPGTAATVLGLTAAAAGDVSARSLTAIPLVCLAVPVAVAAATTALRGGERARRRWWVTGLAVLAAVPVILVLPILLMPIVMVLIGRALGGRGWLIRTGLALAAGVGVVLIAVAVGSTADWFSLFFALLLLGPPLVVAGAYLGVGVLDGIGTLTRRVGPSHARLAAAPLQVRRGTVAPLAAALAVVTILVALDGTVGASFGRREADRPPAAPPMSEPAGTSPDQAIGVIAVTADRAALQEGAATVATTTGTQVTLVDRLGDGGTAPSAGGPPPFLAAPEPSVALVAPGAAREGPTWIGVVDPGSMTALGLGDQADDLVAGRLVVLRPTPPGSDLTPSYTSASPAVEGALPTEAVAASTGSSALFPAALVSPAVAEASGLAVRPARVVVTPDPTRPVAPSALRAAAQQVVDQSDAAPLGTSDGPTMLTALRERDQPVRLGDEPIVTDQPDGPLNAVPVFARTRQEARGRMATLAALALLVTVAGTVLVLGTTRSEDAVLDLQGAARRTRAGLGAIQAGLLAASASVLAAVIGIGLPALAFSTYNGSGRGALPPIPLVVPWEVPALLLALPLASAALAGLAVALRRPLGTDGVPLEDELAW